MNPWEQIMNLNTVLGAAIAKGALSATRKPVAALRGDVAELKRQVAELKRLVRALQKGAQHKAVAASAPETAPETEIAKPTRIRPTGPMVRKLRQKLGLTQVELAKLIGVSGLTISKWEQAGGRIMLRNRTLAALAKVRVMGKREAKAALASAPQP
jgi:DNA-binding transcriptional regulator YiaG